MADSDIFVSNDVQLDVDFGTVYVVDQGIVTKVVAKKYGPTKTYVVGEYVIYQEKLYKCNTAIEEPEEFDAEKWNNVLLADEVQIANANIALKANASDVYAKSETYNKTEVNTALESKADTATTYTKTEVDTALGDKADKSDTYTKTEVDTALSAKANSDDVYAKTDTYSKDEIDTNIYTKSETYNKNEVDGIINNLPAPMIFKGTLGVNGTITTLPGASSDNEGFTYKVITDGTYASTQAKVGDMFTSNGSAWVHIPSGDETFTDTWRSVKVNGTEKLSGSITSGSVDFKNGTNSTAVFDPSDNSIKFNVDGYTQSQVDTKLNAKANSSDVYTKSQTYTKTETNNLLNNKADKATTYTKTEVDEKFDDIEPIKTASGQIATFDTNMADVLQEVKCSINPIQDLHGYDHPWPAGGGKNKLDFEGFLTSNNIPFTKNGNKYAFDTTGTVSFKFVFSETDIEVTLSADIINGTATNGRLELLDVNNQLVTRLDEGRASITGVGSKIRINYSTGGTISIEKPQVELGATATDYEPYENVCPIIGIDEMNISRTGVNIFDEETELGQLNSDGTVSPSASRLTTKNYISVKGGTTYAVTLNTSLGKGRAVWYDANKQAIEYIADFPDTPILENRYALVTAPSNACYFKWCFTTAYGTTYRHDIAILYPSTQTNYVAYNGNTYTVDFGQTVYGGVLDVTRGKLSVTWAKKIYDGSNDENWLSYASNYDGVVIRDTDLKLDGTNPSLQIKANIAQVNTNRGAATTLSGVVIKTYGSISDYNYFFLCGTGITNVEEMRTWLSTHNLEIIYELATPFDIDLTPVQIEALLGVNNVWHDGNGNTEVKYLTGSASDIKAIIAQTNLSDLADIPNPPTTDGTYRLKVTIVNGKATYSWEEIT